MTEVLVAIGGFQVAVSISLRIKSILIIFNKTASRKTPSRLEMLTRDGFITGFFLSFDFILVSLDEFLFCLALGVNIHGMLKHLINEVFVAGKRIDRHLALR